MRAKMLSWLPAGMRGSSSQCACQGFSRSVKRCTFPALSTQRPPEPACRIARTGPSPGDRTSRHSGGPSAFTTSSRRLPSPKPTSSWAPPRATAVMAASTGLAKARWPAVRASARTRVFPAAAQTKPASSSAAPLQGPASRSAGRSRRCQAWGPRSVSTARSSRSPSAARAQTLPKGSSQTGVISHPGGARGAAWNMASPRRTSAHPTHQTSPQRVASSGPGGPSGRKDGVRETGAPPPRG